MWTTMVDVRARATRPAGLTGRAGLTGVAGLAGLVALAALVGCTPAADPGPTGPTAGATRSPGPVTVASGEYREGRVARVHRPVAGGTPRAVVVLVPGGGWASTDPGDVGALAEHLAGHGVPAVTVDYGTDATGDHHPVPAQDVACAVAFAAAEVPGVPVVVAGHSAGGHLALLVGLRPDQGGDCPHPPAAADGVVGLAGPYDLAATSRQGTFLVGAGRGAAPAAWTDADPMTWVTERPELPVLLLHGEDDDVVAPTTAEHAERALSAAGHGVRTVRYPDVDHDGVLRPEVTGRDLLAFVTALARS